VAGYSEIAPKSDVSERRPSFYARD